MTRIQSRAVLEADGLGSSLHASSHECGEGSSLASGSEASGLDANEQSSIHALSSPRERAQRPEFSKQPKDRAARADRLTDSLQQEIKAPVVDAGNDSLACSGKTVGGGGRAIEREPRAYLKQLPHARRLQNIGKTYFVNEVLQCLMAVREFGSMCLTARSQLLSKRTIQSRLTECFIQLRAGAAPRYVPST